MTTACPILLSIAFSVCAGCKKPAPPSVSASGASGADAVPPSVPKPSSVSTPTDRQLEDVQPHESTELPSPPRDVGDTVLEGTVIDFATEKPMGKVSQRCLSGGPKDGILSQDTKDDGKFHWVFAQPGHVEIRSSFTGWSVILPSLARDKDGYPRPDVVGWDIPIGQSQAIEMWRADYPTSDANALQS